MLKFKQTARIAVLYVASVVLVGSAPMSAFADKTDACIDAGRTGKRWTTDVQTGECIKVYDKDMNFIGPSYMAPEPTPTPSSSVSPSPSPTSTPQTQQANDSSDSGEDSDTNVETDVDVDSETNVDNTTTVDNDVDADSTSGDAKVSGNKSGGNAGSGNSSADATVVNSVHSTVGDEGNTGVATFTYDVNGDVVGDITIGPNIPKDSKQNVDVNGETNINNTTDLNNDIDLNAQSGDATVRGNESTGSATSGDANTVVNVLNLINTIIAANQSFVGTINIYGNLNGDILVSPEFIPHLLASNSDAEVYRNLSLTTNINDDNTIINNVNLNAASGNASVKGNETTGSATTGNAQTNLTILNLTGHEVNAANSLLVFVNVLGTWVGMIVDAPGATAAALGSGVTSSKVNLTDETNINNSSRITNNIDLTSQSGDALVAGNESGGSATSGNATASANIANVSTSTFNLTDWFGVLYINVFGTWIGSFGVDTEAGTVTPVGGNAVEQKSGAINAPNMSFGFRPETAPKTQVDALAVGGSTNNLAESVGAAAMLASTSAAVSEPQMNTTSQPATLGVMASSRPADPMNTILMIAGFGVAGISGAWMAVRRWMELRAAATPTIDK